MPNFKAWDIVKVPFPYTDRPVLERRPALVIAVERLDLKPELMWVLMITSAKNRGWVGDVPVSNLGTAGLPAPSVVRTTKVATIEASVTEKIGVLPLADRSRIQAFVKERLLDFFL